LPPGERGAETCRRSTMTERFGTPAGAFKLEFSKTTGMRHRELHDGRSDGLQPLESLSLEDAQTVSQLVRAMSKTAFGGRQLGEAADVLQTMFRDEDCKVVMTLSGAMTVAKQGRIICDMIDRGLVQAVISTGALIAHGLTE